MCEYDVNKHVEWVNEDIINGIEGAYNNGSILGAVKQIYSGMDYMARMKSNKAPKNIKAKQFTAWVEEYISFVPYISVSGMELWSSRNAAIHMHSLMTSKNNSIYTISIIGGPEVINAVCDIDGIGSKGYKFIHIESLISAFYEGANRFLQEVQSDPNKRRDFSKRMESYIAMRVDFDENHDIVQWLKRNKLKRGNLLVPPFV